MGVGGWVDGGAGGGVGWGASGWGGGAGREEAKPP